MQPKIVETGHPERGTIRMILNEGFLRSGKIKSSVRGRNELIMKMSAVKTANLSHTYIFSTDNIHYR